MATSQKRKKGEPDLKSTGIVLTKVSKVFASSIGVDL